MPELPEKCSPAIQKSRRALPTYSKYGKSVYAVGSNEKNARLAGLNVTWVKIIVSIPGLSVDIQDTFQGLVLIIVILIQTIGPIIKENDRNAKNRRLSAETEKAEAKNG